MRTGGCTGYVVAMTASTKPFAVVTGASCGIGKELAEQFAEHGFDLLVAAEDDGIKTVGGDWEQLGAHVQRMQVDLAERAGVEQLAERITLTGRVPDAVAINAGIGSGGDFARQTDLETELTLVDLNVRSAVHLAKRVLGPMVERGSGRVLFTGSIAGTQPGPFEAVYAASKAFIGSFAEALRNELSDTGVTVTVLMPGPTETNFFRRAGMMDTKVGTGSKDSAREVAEQGYETMMAGKASVVAGSAKNSVLAAVSQVAPDKLTAQLHRTMSEPGSADR